MSNVQNYTLFKPDKINVFRDYPELNDYPELKALSHDEMLFVWKYANDTSEINGIENDKVRSKKAYKLVFGETNDTQQQKYAACDFPPHVRAAVEVMASFKPSARMRAKLMVEKTFEDYETILHADLPTEVDELKKVMELRLKISKDLPDLIKLMEQGFGIRNEVEETKEGDRRQASYMDNIHDHMSKN